VILTLTTTDPSNNEPSRNCHTKFNSDSDTNPYPKLNFDIDHGPNPNYDFSTDPITDPESKPYFAFNITLSLTITPGLAIFNML